MVNYYHHKLISVKWREHCQFEVMATERWIFAILYLVACVQTEEFEEAPDLPADDGLSIIMYLLWIITIYYEFNNCIGTICFDSAT